MPSFRISFHHDSDKEKHPLIEYVIDAPTEKEAMNQAYGRFALEHPKENRDYYTAHSENAQQICPSSIAALAAGRARLS